MITQIQSNNRDRDDNHGNGFGGGFGCGYKYGTISGDGYSDNFNYYRRMRQIQNERIVT
jgi:hypothetical protein